MIQNYTPKSADELELVVGDLIYIEEKLFNSSADGWVRGTSWLTGMYKHNLIYNLCIIYNILYVAVTEVA